jgi:hypothetical protein
MFVPRAAVHERGIVGVRSTHAMVRQPPRAAASHAADYREKCDLRHSKMPILHTNVLETVTAVD